MKQHFDRIKITFISFVSQGISPQKLSLAIAFGIFIGIIPFLGVTTFLCTVFALAFQLNMPIIQAVHYLFSPLQFLLYIPFMKAGAWLAGIPFHYTLPEIKELFSQDFFGTVMFFLEINIYAVLFWLLASPFLFGLPYFVSLFVTKRIESKKAKI